jgi:hypothetical protein
MGFEHGAFRIGRRGATHYSAMFRSALYADIGGYVLCHSDSFHCHLYVGCPMSLAATIFAAWDGLLWWSQLFYKRNTSGRRSSWSALKSALEECDRFSGLSSPAGWLSSPDL